jgi:hypothetical protein
MDDTNDLEGCDHEDMPPTPQDQLDLIAYIEPPVDPSKTGNKPKKLVAIEVMGFEIGRGLRKRVVCPEDVYKLAALGCSDKEIALWFDVEYSTLKYNFSSIIAKGREDLKHTLRHAMLKNALGGNAALQIFLAKNFLGMSDNPINSNENSPLPWTDSEI